MRKKPKLDLGLNAYEELFMNENERIEAMRPAVELSYLTLEEQKVVYDETILRDCMPSHAQAIRMRKMSARSMLTDSAIDDIMKEEKPNQKEKIHIPYSEIRMLLPKGMSFDKTTEYIKKALEYYQKNHSKKNHKAQ